jgi:anthranilate synthase component 2
LPDCLVSTADADDGVMMGLSHRSLPIHGVQFHPESIASEHGHRLLSNFLRLAGHNVQTIARRPRAATKAVA